MKVVQSNVEFNHDELPEACQHCGSTRCVVNQRDGTHHAECVCANCDTHLKFMPKPSSHRSRDKRQDSSEYDIEDILNHHGFNEARCFFCRRGRSQLSPNETLTRDHIRELEHEDGEDRLGNLQILCTKCHALKNHARRYLKEYTEPVYKAYREHESQTS